MISKINKKRNKELRGSDKSLPKYNLHIDKTGQGFAVDDNGRIIGKDAAIGLSEATVTTKRNWIDKFKKDNPEMFDIINQIVNDNLQKRTQAGFYDATNRPTISKEEAERNKNNYFEVAALNTAMGSPYIMNQNSFNYNPTIADQQINFGATYPISSINNAFYGALGDAALNYGLKYVGRKAIPVITSHMLNKSIKNWDGTVNAEYFHDPYSWYRITNSVEPAGISELGAQFTTRDMPEYSSIDKWRSALNNIPTISVKKDGYYINPKKRFSLSFIKNSSAHGNTSQASKGKIWENSVSTSPLFKRGILEGQAPVEVYQGKNINGGDSRSRFILTPWDEVTNGGRIGFHSGEMPLQGLRWFEKLPNQRYRYYGEVIPEHRIQFDNSKIKEPIKIGIFQKPLNHYLQGVLK